MSDGRARICSVAYGEQSVRARSRLERCKWIGKIRPGCILEIFTTSHHSVARSRCGGGGALLNTVQPNEFRAQTSMNIVPILSIVIVVRGTIPKANLLDCDIKRAGIYICKIEAAGTPSIIPNTKKKYTRIQPGSTVIRKTEGMPTSLPPPSSNNNKAADNLHSN